MIDIEKFTPADIGPLGFLLYPAAAPRPRTDQKLVQAIHLRCFPLQRQLG
jgi:hypothetical protein